MNTVVTKLKEQADEQYRQFNQNMIKGSSPIIGVRIPELRKIAKKIKKNNYEEFMQEYEGIYFEEKLLKGLIIASDAQLFQKNIWNFIKEIDSWCLCDTFCTTCKFIKEDLDKYFSYIEKMLESDEEFTIRLGFVLLLNYYINDEYVDKIITYTQKYYPYYYVNMAISWLLSEIYVTYPEKIIKLLEQNTLNDFIKLKTIEKINDSYRVSQENKLKVNQIK